jgi:hypothetical protein
MLTLSGGGSVTLFGVASLDGVAIGDIPPIHGGASATLAGWKVASADAYDAASSTTIIRSTASSTASDRTGTAASPVPPGR